MRRFIRLCMGECYKTKHTIISGHLHIGIPLAGSMVLLLYYRASGAETIVSLSTFTQLTGLAFPFIVSLVCACQTGLEEGNHFQTFLGGSAGWLCSILGKVSGASDSRRNGSSDRHRFLCVGSNVSFGKCSPSR